MLEQAFRHEATQHTANEPMLKMKLNRTFADEVGLTERDAATTMLDSHVDQLEDAVNGDHSYVAHYPTEDIATRRISALIGRSMQEASGLPDSERHILIVACMTAMYLSKSSAWTTVLRSSTRQILASAGPLVHLLLPILWLWRITYLQGSS